ncbi:DUF4429 domain-containing protein [Streptomyces sp. XM4193]|uniref:DUF4429 domain-containing protein n=1 Tax=Streptomyces sp. XM4193 TaxID=2929782 RepID=UPI001FFA3A57|nr:DUF4429 domain-containing protein [Streptomyces sp. XM4193]MCK1794544.1 DUF4429 domain-containing protein [Streptomyces sp. XM4193]
MAEIIQSDGTWTFDGEMLRIVPGGDKGVSLLRKSLGEITVPVEALASISYEPGKKKRRLRLRIRAGADPLTQVAGGKWDDASDPYQLTVRADRGGVAEYLVDSVRQAMVLEEVPAGPSDRYLMPGPALPATASAGDGSATFDGETVRLDWNWKTEEAKASFGANVLPLEDILAVEWQPSQGWENGHLRFTVRGATTKAPPKHDPNAVDLYGFRKDPLMVLVAAAVQARLPHPSAAEGSGAVLAAVEEPAATSFAKALAPAEGQGSAPGGEQTEDHDALLRRLRELGELHRDGILTDEEFAAAKQAVLRRM